MAELNEDYLQQLEDGSTIVLTSSDQITSDDHQHGMSIDPDAETQELVEEIIGHDDVGHDEDHIIDDNVTSMHDLITLHAVDSQGHIIGDNEQMQDLSMGQGMEQMMDTENIVEEVITSAQDDEQQQNQQQQVEHQDQFLDQEEEEEEDLDNQQYLGEEVVFNHDTGTLQPVSSISSTANTTKISTAPKKPVQKQQIKYIIQASGQGSDQQQIVLDAQSFQGLINSGASVIKGSGGQNLIIAGNNQQKKIQQIRSPTKILPAPSPSGDQQYQTTTITTTSGGGTPTQTRYIMKQGNVLTPVSSQGGKIVQVGSGSNVRYVQLVQNKNIGSTSKIPITQSKPVTPKTSTGQTFVVPSNDLQNQGLNNYVVVPHNFMVKNEVSNQSNRPVNTSDSTEGGSGGQAGSGNFEPFRSLLEPNGMRPRKPCNCTKSQCLKLYCDCFANGEFCHLCNCTSCFNNLDHEEERQKAIKLVLERNPGAFRPKIGKSSSTGEAHERRHNKGCNCRKSGCLKNYCECYEAKIFCSGICKCTGCKNCIENIPTGLPNGMGVEQHFAGAGTSHRQTLKDLAEAAEVRVQQQTQVKNKMRAQMQEVSPQNNLGIMVPPLVFRYPQGSISYEVVTSTVELLLAKAEAAEKQKLSEGDIEKVILDEFGDCLAAVMELGNTVDNM